MTNRPVLRWHGGKSQMADWIIFNFLPHRCYVEPYAGAASVLMQKGRCPNEVYNDLDEEIFNVFKVLRDHGSELREKLELTPFSQSEFDLSFEDSTDHIERARRMLVRAAFGRSSASATSKYKASFRNYSGASRTTTAAQDWANYSSVINDFTTRLRGVVIENKDAKSVIKSHDSSSTLFYVDPPYVESTRSAAGGNYRHEMTETEHVVLSEVLLKVKGMVVLSGYQTDLYRSLYAGWRTEELSTHGDGGCERTEVLWFSPNCLLNRLL